ncbi:unnamed protein product [Linum tenue]|uniref:Leucine-rich repeat-containing N-terminal plant-type domain-containing protein n=1 Tax=Linum tenue TaxID=586396 RepID=A0AAV0IF48_9ROSI|nr:unnamed protein product [Linum tenue]
MEAVLVPFVFVFIALILQAGEVKSNAEEEALTSLRNSLADPNNVLASWDPTLVTPCTWFHITCNSDNRVVRLSLYENKIEGTIPADIGNLTKLMALDLRANSISGTIPPSLGQNLQSLTFLGLEDNRLTGQVPHELGNIPNLKFLNISNNNLCGFLPIELLRVPTLDWSNNPGIGKVCP